MSSHDTVLKWNDSAGEESFHDAKRRFWSEINGLPCAASPPDPDMYNDEIDWNPEIDPELISDLDRAYFNPDEAEKVHKVDITNQKELNNPWECSNVHGTRDLKDIAKEWNLWDKPRISENVGNPWEHSYTQGDGAVKDNVWGGIGNKSWGQNNNSDNSWGHGGQNVGNNSCDWTHGLRNVDKGENHWGGTRPSRASKDKRWGDSGNDSWGWKHWENQNNESNYLESRGPGRGGGAFNGGCRKREGSQQHTSRYKSARFQSDDSGMNNQWGHQRNQKRVSFV